MKWKYRVERRIVWHGMVEAEDQAEAKKLADQESDEFITGTETAYSTDVHPIGDEPE